jgi:transglycosylase-like protein with SLT domain
MIRKTMSVGQKWLGAFAFTIIAALLGSQAAIAQVITPSAAISFPKKAAATTVKKSVVETRSRKKRYTKRRSARKSVRRIGKRTARKISRRKVRRTSRRNARRFARRSNGISYQPQVARKSYKKRRYARGISNKRVSSRSRGALMATLRSVKPSGLPLRLAVAVVTVESGWRVNARGSSGERGLMQLMPATARLMGARGNLYNPRINMRAGTKYLNWCYRRARRNVAATIGCYNRGPGRMWAWSKNRITRRYVSRVRRYMRRG